MMSCTTPHQTRQRCATIATTLKTGLVLNTPQSKQSQAPLKAGFYHAQILGLAFALRMAVPMVFGRDAFDRKAGGMACSMCSTSRPPYALEQAKGGFQSQQGAGTMTKPQAVKKTQHPSLSFATVTRTNRGAWVSDDFFDVPESDAREAAKLVDKSAVDKKVESDAREAAKAVKQ